MNIEVHYYEMDTDGNYSYMYDTLPYTGLTESTFYVPDYSKSGFHLDRSRHSSGNPSIVVSGNESANIIDVYYERERYYLETSGRSYQIPGSGMIYFVGISPDKQPYYQYYYEEEITLEYLHPY